MAQHRMTGDLSAPSLLISQPWYVNMMQTLNTVWHERSLQIFMAIVLAHWAEHLVQAYQIYALGWPIPESLGVIGYWFDVSVRTTALWHWSCSYDFGF